MKKNITIKLTLFFLLFASGAFSQTVSKEARYYFDRGVAAFETAKSNADYEDTIREFKHAARLAPDWPDVYYNLGLVQKKLGKNYDSVRSFKKYIELSPDANDHREVEKLIAQIEYATEKKMKPTLRKWLKKVGREELLSSDNPDKKSLTEALTDAACVGRNDIIKVLLSMGADINYKDDRERTALIWAVCVAQKETVELLLDMGADVNIKDEYGRTCLMYVAQTGNCSVETMKTMIDMGADINARGSNGMTGLMLAAKEGQVEAVKLLLDKGADINEKSNFGRTSLIWAAKIEMKEFPNKIKAYTEIVKILLAMGADVNAEDTFTNTALAYAEESDNTGEIASLLRQAEAENIELQQTEAVNFETSDYNLGIGSAEIIVVAVVVSFILFIILN